MADVLTQEGAVTIRNLSFTVNSSGGITATGTITKTKQLDIDALTKPPVNPPTVVTQDNTIMLEFTVDTDELYKNFPVPDDYAQTGGLGFHVMWTNDGGVDDNGLNVKVQLSNQTSAVGDSIAGNHANSPKTTEDTYTSASGHILHRTEVMTIAHADVSGMNCVHVQIMFVTPAGGALTCDPRMLGMCVVYTAYQVVLAT